LFEHRLFIKMEKNIFENKNIQSLPFRKSEVIGE